MDSHHVKLNGAYAQVCGLSSAGIVLAGETSAPPRGLGLILAPENPIAEFRMRGVRPLQPFYFKGSPLNLAEKLSPGATANFMYYRVTQARTVVA